MMRVCQPGTLSAKPACPTAKQSALGTRARSKLGPGYYPTLSQVFRSSGFLIFKQKIIFNAKHWVDESLQVDSGRFRSFQVDWNIKQQIRVSSSQFEY